MFKKFLFSFSCLLLLSGVAEANSPLSWSLDRSVTPFNPQYIVDGVPKSIVGEATVLADNYGAIGDGVADDRAAIAAAAAALGSQGGVVYLSCGKNYRIGTNLTIPTNVTLKHCRGYGGEAGTSPGIGIVSNQPHIRLDSTASIFVSPNSGVDAVILRTGATFPAADASAYAGTAIKYLATSHVLDVRINALIVGFATCLDPGTVADASHYKLHIECDANPPAGTGAVILPKSFDSSEAFVRTWPWGTYGNGTLPPNTSQYRTGIGIHVPAGSQDDTRFDFLDLGHDIGVLFSANGNYHVTHLWTDNNTSYGVQFNAGDRVNIDAAWIYTSKGIRFNSNGVYSFGYLLSDSASVLSANAIETAAGASPEISIGTWYVTNATAFAASLGSTTAKLTVGKADIRNVQGGAVSPIVGVAGWKSDQVTIGQVDTDLPNGASLLGGNVVTINQIASAATMALPVSGHVFEVTGTATINTMNGTWGGREVTLKFTSTAALTTTGNIQLRNGIPLQGAAGVTVDLIHDQVANKWLEKGRNLGTAAFANTGTSGHTLPYLDGNNAFSGTNTATTQAANDNSTKLATTAYVDAKKRAETGQCTMAAGACTAQSFGVAYAAAPVCFLTWTGTGSLAGALKVVSATTTVTPSSSNGADTAQVNWACFGN